MIPMETKGAGSWFAGLLKGGHSRTKSSEVTADSPTSFDLGKEEPDSHSEGGAEGKPDPHYMH